jgi:hypothetical protein
MHRRRPGPGRGGRECRGGRLHPGRGSLQAGPERRWRRRRQGNLGGRQDVQPGSQQAAVGQRPGRALRPLRVDRERRRRRLALGRDRPRRRDAAGCHGLRAIALARSWSMPGPGLDLVDICLWRLAARLQPKRARRRPLGCITSGPREGEQDHCTPTPGGRRGGHSLCRPRPTRGRGALSSYRLP